MDNNTLLSKDKLVFSFTLTYVLLLTTGSVTFIEAIGTNIPFVRHLFNLETLISIVAGFFYSKFVDRITKSFENNSEVPWGEIVKMRYLDWSITTPMMLMVLMIVLCQHSQKKPHFMTYILVVVLDYIMLYVGYQGEFSQDNTKHVIISFISFFLMFYVIYSTCFGKSNSFNNFIFFFYVIVWSIYGLVYKLDIKTKNTVYNYLDLTSKCFVGIGLWLYFTKLFKL